jgi:2-polyprenyl-3-methyl-5-hydroxy-6-metoxy-1,4-benzoquinol methylase
VLGNLVNRDDAGRLYRKLRHGQVKRIAEKLRVRGQDRVLTRWAEADPSLEKVQWDEIPAVRRRWLTVGTGGSEVCFPEHVARTWLAGRPRLRALSPGCGTGVWEIDWARLGVFDNITGIDISPEQIERASQLAKTAGLDHVLSYRVADARQVLREGGQFDVVLVLQALHHFRHVEETMELIARALRPGGLLIFDDYVGPSKYQWAKAQVRAANALLAELPAERRVQNDGRIKRRVLRPSLLSMRLDDPAEAAESAALMPSLRRHFTIVEEHSYGSILHLALQDVAHNFIADDPATAQVVEQCIAAEDQALARLGANFVLAVCRPHDKPGAGSPAGRTTAGGSSAPPG